jgi:hypothetical protein
MEQSILAEVKDDLDHIDVDSLKFDAIIQLKAWQKKMHASVDRTYKNRLDEINGIASNRANEINDRRNRMQHFDRNDQHLVQQFKNQVDALKSDITVVESIPESFDRRIERTIRIHCPTEQHDDDVFEEEDDDDEPVIVDFERDHARTGDRVTVVVAAASPTTQPEGRVARVFNSQPVQHALAVSLVKTMAQMGTVVAASTTTAAATSMAKTAVIATACGIGTVAYGVGRITIGTTRKIYSLVFSSDE